MLSDLDLALPDESAGTDTALTTTGVVYAVDVSGRRVQVGLRGSVLWLPAMPGRYVLRAASMAAGQGMARVLLNPATGRPVHVLGPVDTRDPAVLGTVTATGTNSATVTVDGISYTLPAIPSTYTVGQTAWVLLSDWGVPTLVLGPSALAAPAASTPTAPSGGSTVQASFTIGPQWSGTYRAGQGWDQWNTTRYGGRSDLYQGNAYGSGTLTGLATYGDQLVNLGATSIDSMTLTVYRQPGTPASSLTVQGTPAGSQPSSPAPSGTTATTPSVAGGSWTSVGIPSDVREALRTGAAKSLAAVGAAYGDWGGTSTGGSMVLTGTYTRPA